MQKYISIDSTNDTTDTKICMTNNDNEICGTLKTKDTQDANKVKDVNEIFVHKKELEDIEQVDMTDEEYSLKTVTEKLNSLIAALKGGTLALAICMLGFSSLAADPPAGKQKFGTISAKTYVVTNEVDPEFSTFKNNKFSVAFGSEAKAGSASVAIGVPLLTSASGGPVDGLSMNYLGPTEAKDRAVAIGDSAKAMEKVSVAIGNQANVRGLQVNSGKDYTYNLNLMEVVTVKDEDNNIVSVTTNKNVGSNTYTVDMAMYERLPVPNSNWRLIESKTVKDDNGVSTITSKYEQSYDSLFDIAYITDEEKSYYDKIIKSGQGDANLKDAQYGVAVGSRAYVSGYHGASFGHYAHVSRPFGLAIGSEAHSYSEGGQAFGYDSDIATNSQYSLAIGMNASIPSGMSNAIVLGVPDIKTSDNRTAEGAIRNRPTAMKSNSINFVYNGEGLKDFFIDNTPITDRLGSEVQVIGTSIKGSNSNGIIQGINYLMGLPEDNKDMVFFSADGGMKLFTHDYIDEPLPELKGDASQIEINGMPLPNVIRKYASGTETSDQNFVQYHTIVTNQARIAYESISNSTDLQEIKTVLMNFFNNIK